MPTEIISTERVRETDFYTRTWDALPSFASTITFKHSPEAEPFRQHEYDWYITVALEKADKVKDDRHLLTRDLILAYRWAIREGYNHQLDPALQRDFDYPRNRNTINGILGYIKRIEKASESRG